MTFTALSATSKTLAEFLRGRLAAATGLPDFFASGTLIVSLNSPQEMADNQLQGLSVWLYRVIRDNERLNAPPKRLNQTERRRTPLPLRLHYLITPIVNSSSPDSPGSEQDILGRVLQALYDHPILKGVDLDASFIDREVELHARLEPLTLEEMARVYDTLEQSFQLSVSYEVSTVLIESEIEPEGVSPVQVVIPEYGVVVGPSES